jgi:hypothetical protein
MRGAGCEVRNDGPPDCRIPLFPRYLRAIGFVSQKPSQPRAASSSERQRKPAEAPSALRCLWLHASAADCRPCPPAAPAVIAVTALAAISAVTVVRCLTLPVAALRCLPIIHGPPKTGVRVVLYCPGKRERRLSDVGHRMPEEGEQGCEQRPFCPCKGASAACNRPCSGERGRSAWSCCPLLSEAHEQRAIPYSCRPRASSIGRGRLDGRLRTRVRRGGRGALRGRGGPGRRPGRRRRGRCRWRPTCSPRRRRPP